MVWYALRGSRLCAEKTEECALSRVPRVTNATGVPIRLGQASDPEKHKGIVYSTHNFDPAKRPSSVKARGVLLPATPITVPRG